MDEVVQQAQINVFHRLSRGLVQVLLCVYVLLAMCNYFWPCADADFLDDLSRKQIVTGAVYGMEAIRPDDYPNNIHWCLIEYRYEYQQKVFYDYSIARVKGTQRPETVQVFVDGARPASSRMKNGSKLFYSIKLSYLLALAFGALAGGILVMGVGFQNPKWDRIWVQHRWPGLAVWAGALSLSVWGCMGVV